MIPLRIEPYAELLHYPLLHGWWLGHAHEPERAEGLPGSGRPGHGVLAYAGTEPLACGFIYETGTLLWLGPHYFMVNPALHGIEGGKALGDAGLDAVVAALEAYVAAQGGGAVATFTDEPAVIARARRHGYQLRGRVPMLGKWVAAAGAQAAQGTQAAQPEPERQGGGHG